MKFVVMTQYLENYGAHCEDGKFANGNAYWKFKGGSDYLVEGLERPQDAMAFVASICMENNLYCKEFPSSVQTFSEWVDSEFDGVDTGTGVLFNADFKQEHYEFRMKHIKKVNPVLELGNDDAWKGGMGKFATENVA